MLWDFGDGGTSDEPNPLHQYMRSGNYTVTLAVIDNGSAPTTLTDTTYAIINDYNSPPSPPAISGPSWGKIQITHTYTFTVEDPDDDQVFLLVDWGDGTNSSWQGPYDSDSTVQLGHLWQNSGSYSIKAKTKDEHGLESTWSTYAVRMPKNLWRSMVYQLFLT
jgi:PKD repeat protein